MNGLKLNCSKTQIICFKTIQNKEDFVLQINGEEEIVKQANLTKFLGVQVQNNLKWNEYILILSKRLSTVCFQMTVLQNVTDLKTKMIVYYALFHSLLLYGIEFWGNHGNAESIFKIQKKKIIRIITFSNHRCSCREIFKQLNLLTLPSLYILQSLLFIKRNLNLFMNENHQNIYSTRHREHCCQLPIHRLTSLEKLPQYAGKNCTTNYLLI